MFTRLARAAIAASVLVAATGTAIAGHAVVYKDPNFRGQALTIDGPVANLAYGRFNDTISSIDLSGAWEICVDPNFRGRCQIIDGSVARLSNIRMNDNITSMRPLERGADRRGSRSRDYGRGNDRQYAAINLFRDPGFRGRSIGFDGAIYNLNQVGFNDTASSIQVNSGRWLVCEHPDFRGRCEVVTGGISHLSTLGLNDRITSIRPYDRRRDRRDRNRDTRYGDRDHDYGYRDHQYGQQTYRFDDPRDAYGRPIHASRRNARQFCQNNGFREVIEVERNGGYFGCIICAR